MSSILSFYHHATSRYTVFVKRVFLVLIFSVCGTVAVVALFVARSPLVSLSDIRTMVAGVFFAESTTPEALKTTYARAFQGGDKVRVLIVPGHDDESWGTEFRGVREADLTALLGEELTRFLSSTAAYQPLLVRGRRGYAAGFKEYLEKERNNVRAFVAERKKTMGELVRQGSVEKRTGVVHNKASSEAAEKLYAVNKWANEHDVDIVLHLHFNDYPGRPKGRPGRYDGFSLYIPESQFGNARASRAVAESMFEQFSVFYGASNLPLENGGMVEDQNLIAIGAHNTLDAASILIEYGYIYEERFLDIAVREAALKELAFQTYQGLQRFFRKENNASLPYETGLLPHAWKEPLRQGAAQSPDVLSLQTALLALGFYPPGGKSKRDCPLSGSFGPCTESAVKKFQEKYGLPVSGAVEGETLEKLNEKYSK